MPAFVNVNGRITDAAHAVIPVFDHGFLYGEGVYETLRTYDGEPFLFDRHLERLRVSAAMIQLDVPISDAELLRRSRQTMAAAGLGERPEGGSVEAYLRILLTRGVGDLTYDPAATPTPSVVIITKPLADTPLAYYEAGVPVVLVDMIRNHPCSVSPLIKSNNLLNNVMAMQQAIRRGGVEAVFRNYRGELAECSQSNLFVVKNRAVRTPGLESGLLAGLTRAFVIEIGATMGLRIEETTLTEADLFGADEAFFTSTTRELIPIVRVNERAIGDGRPGPITRSLLDTFRRKARESVAAARSKPLTS